MNRPCFSLGVLLSSLAVCLIAVGSANSQTGVDAHAPACLMCPYAGSTYPSPAFNAATTDSQPDVDKIDYDLDYEAEYEAEYSDADYDYADYDYGDKDYENTGSDYDYGYGYGYDYDYDYDYDYENSESLESTTVEADYDENYSDYDYSDYDYSDYDYADDQTVGEEVADVPQDDDSSRESVVVPSTNADEYSEFDNYDYEDYFAEVYGTDGVASDVDTPPIVETETDVSAAESSTADASVVANEDVDAFDFFDQEAFEPSATDLERAYEDADLYEGYDRYESDYELIEKTEAAPTEDPNTPKIDPSGEADAALYNLHTTYDAIYDEVMGSEVDTPENDAVEFESPAVGPSQFNTMDHCFGGYSDPYRSEYRCDLADAYQDDAYQSFYHDGSDPSATQIDADEADADLTPAFPISVQPYVALVMERIGTAWEQFSLDAIVSRTVSQVAKLPSAFPQSPVELEATDSIADYVDCHVDAGSCDPNWCEIDCFQPWEPACPIGSGIEASQEAVVEPTELDAEPIDRAALDAMKASIRDLRSRMNAARQSPPLR